MEFYDNLLDNEYYNNQENLFTLFEQYCNDYDIQGLCYLFTALKNYLIYKGCKLPTSYN